MKTGQPVQTWFILIFSLSPPPPKKERLIVQGGLFVSICTLAVHVSKSHVACDKRPQVAKADEIRVPLKTFFCDTSSSNFRL